MPIISVVVPVYKAEHCLCQCIDSILEQSFSDFELILVDDGSPDRSGSICEHYVRKDLRVRVVHKKNGGVSSARNLGLELVRGEYIIFVDSDDYIERDYLEKLYNGRSDLTICGFSTFNQVGEKLYSLKFRTEQFLGKDSIDYEYLYKKNMLYAPYGKLFRSEIIKNNAIVFPEEISWGEDSIFIADYLCHTNSINIIDSEGYCYIKYEDDTTLSTKVRKNIVEMITTSREYCINRVKEHSPNYYNLVKTVCETDIKSNCAYFLLKTLENRKMKIKEKAEVVDNFLENKYIKYIILHSEKYYQQNKMLQICLKGKTGSHIVIKYNIMYFLIGMKERIYGMLPEGIKDIHRSIKRKGYDT